MKHHFLFAMALATGAIPVTAQSLSDLDLQIHGYATQGYVYSTHNNMLYSNSTDGSSAWTEAVVHMDMQPKSGLAIGVQARYQLLGDSGNTITLDWAAADYSFNDHFGVRAGKVKTPWGLFNETQDIDPSYMWTLLPQSIYDITTRNADLSHYGGVAYGNYDLGKSAGKLQYRLWAGEAVIPTDDGQFDDLNTSGNGPKKPFIYGIWGGALHWRTPVEGLMVGASDYRANKGDIALKGGTESLEAWNNLSYFARYDKNKLMMAAEWNRQASPGILQLDGEPTESASSDARGWYVMTSYRLKDKLSVGAYQSQFFDKDAPLGFDRYSKDWTASMRYDFNEIVYLKAEQHFIQGTALDVDPVRNKNPHDSTALTAFRIGVSF